MSMKRERCRIKPLLAGRFRPHRTPPRDARTVPGAPSLRISFSAQNDHPSDYRIEAASPAQGVSQARTALMNADQALNTAHSSLHLIDEAWKRIESSIVDPEASSSAPRIRESKATTQEQREIDRLIEAIDHACADARYAGEHLLGGSWSVAIDDETGAASQSFTLPQINTSTLGSERIGGFISALATDGDYDVISGCVADARAIVRAAMFQIAGIRENIAEFLLAAVEPARSSMDVAAENAAAATSVLLDVDFIRQAGGVTQIDALIAGKAALNQQSFLHIFS
jgi:hypothetical protein